MGRKRAIYFQSIIDKISSHISGWQHNLIKHLLSSIPIHILSVISPPKWTIKEIERIFLSSSGAIWARGQRHWMSWTQFCLPLEENDLGFTSLHNLPMVFSYKLWWLYHTSYSIWAKFMHSKYGDFSYFRTYGAPFSMASQTWSCIRVFGRRLNNIFGFLFGMEIPLYGGRTGLMRDALSFQKQ